MSTRYAFVTLLTSDAYLPGALTVVAALNDIHRPLDQTVKYETVCLVTPETVDVTTIKHLRKAFDVVIGVEIIAPAEADSLSLLGRPDLDTALTKLHVFRLTQYSKVIFLDADVLPLRPLFHLFLLDHEFSAAPDVGWPDIFNSGVMVLSPGEDKFRELRELLNAKGTWDGADQGLLNEWRGNNWNRLSFTYNTTPTATYTYAPAYQRFGSQISVVHFIGPNKPWHSIAYRAPGSSAQPTGMATESSTEPTATHQYAYDYGSLVDRWYSVYDQHYRSQPAEPTFQPGRFTSAWNDDGLRHVGVADGFGLEELRRIALEGMGASGISVPRAYGEGEYQTMPLEGRFDLMRPRTRVERKHEQVPRDDAETPESTPTPVERAAASTPEPSTPPAQILSLQSGSPARWATLPTPGIDEIPAAPQARLISLPPTPHHSLYKSVRNTREAGAQTMLFRSQPGSGGNDSSPSPPAKTPPHIVMPASTDTYFSKVWDTDRNWSSMSPSSSETSLTTMDLSPSKPQPSPKTFFTSSHIPPISDMLNRQGQYRNVIKEGDGSPTPDPTKVKRVFPWEERPRRTPGRVFPDEGSPLAGLPYPPIFVTPERKSASRSPMPSPLAGFPPSFQPHHTPEGLLPKYADKTPWSVPSPSPLGLEVELDRAETSSQDGDIEDEVDSEEEAVMRLRKRSSSIGMAKRTLQYRSIGVQTEPMEVHEKETQVTTFVPETEVTEKIMLMNQRLRRNFTGNTDFPTSPLSSTRASSSSLLYPPIDYSNGSKTADRDSSPSSPGGQSPSRIRQGSRVWDPARGVEAFKRGSEEVLTKFMQMGFREEQA